MPGAAGQLKRLYQQIIGGTAPAGAASSSGDVSQMVKYLIDEMAKAVGATNISPSADTSGSLAERIAWLQANGGGSVDVQTFTSNGTWTKPSGAKYVFIWAVGGGGGGGSGASYYGGGGGGRGFEMIPASKLGATESVTVGSGGGAGSDGGNSYMAHVCGGGGQAGGSSSSFGKGGDSMMLGYASTSGLFDWWAFAIYRGGSGKDISGNASVFGGGGGGGNSGGSYAGGASGRVAGGAGASAGTNGALPRCGSGGGGNNAGAGGAGGYPGGGGGAGSTTGGAGGRGEVLVLTIC